MEKYERRPRIQLNLTQPEYEAIVKAAALADVSIREFAKVAAMLYAGEVIQKWGKKMG